MTYDNHGRPLVGTNAPPPQAITSIFPDSYYLREFNVNGDQHIGYLTYGLGSDPTVDPERNFLLANTEEIIPPALEAEYDNFVRASMTDNRGGRFVKAKSFAGQILLKPSDYPHAVVTVHKFGPVPTFATGIKVPVELHGELIHAEIVIFRDTSKIANSSHTENTPELATSALVETLRGDLPIVMRRYFEDVGEFLRDIREHANLDRVFETEKSIERFIGQSIQSKLKETTPQLEEWQQFHNPATLNNLKPHQVERCTLFERYRYRYYLFTYARLCVLYALNELYEHIGLTSQSEKYADRLRALRRDFNERFGEEFADHAERQVAELRVLVATIEAYFTRDEDRLFALETSVRWVARVTQFFQFLYDLQSERIPAERGRLFISFQHGIPSAQKAKRLIETQAKNTFGDGVAIISVHESEADTRLWDLIRVRIWQADRVLVIVPKWQEDFAQESKNYTWISREAEYAFMLGKRVIYITEHGFDENALIEELSNQEMLHLVPDARVRHGRNARLLADYKNRVRLMMRLGNEDKTPLEHDLAKEIERNARRAMEMRQEHLVRGYLKQFSKENRFLFACMHLYARDPQSLTKAALAVKLVANHPAEFSTDKRARQAITNAWNTAKDRSMTIRGQEYRAMSLHNNRYSLTLSQLLKGIPTDEQDKAALERKERKLLGQVQSSTYPVPW